MSATADLLPSVSTLQRAAVLDLGSNSFHVLVADVTPDGIIIPSLREREMLHLGGVIVRHGLIPDDVADRAVAVVAHFSELAGRAGASEVRAVATSALREATNGPAVLERLRDAAHTDIEVVDGLEEAELSYLGVRSSLREEDRVLVLDLGGGSLELVVGEGRDVLWADSVPLGVSRLTAQYVQNDPLTVDEVTRIAEVVAANLTPRLRHVDDLAPTRTVAVGGTIRALARTWTGKGAWIPLSMNLLDVDAADIRVMKDELVAATTDEREAMRGLKSRRADHLHVAAIVVATALELIGVERITISDAGLREGVLLRSLGITEPPPQSALRRASIQRLRDTFVRDDPHLDHVAHLALDLFDGTRELHGLGDDDRDLLLYAAEVHDVGEKIALRGHHKHSAYLVENAELRGFSPGEIAMLATLVRFHKDGLPERSYDPYASLSDTNRERVHKLVGILQLADGLDRARDQRVRTVRVARVDDRAVQLHLVGEAGGLDEAEAKRKAATFEDEFGRAVNLHSVGPLA